MKADKGHEGKVGDVTSLRSSQGNLPEIFIQEGPHGASLRAKEGVGDTILARYVDPRAKEYVRRANLYAELVEALEALLLYENEETGGFLDGDVRKARAALSKAKP